MPIILSKRNKNLVEWMEKPDCDPQLLSNTYQQFSRINKILSGWDKIYADYIKPEFIKNGGKATLLDIGCGGGDIIRLLDKLTRNDRFDATFTGIDADPRAIDFLSKQNWPENISFYGKLSEELARENQSFDIVISNHVIHHLSKKQLQDLCFDAKYLSKNLVLFSDIERNDAGYLSFQLIAPLFFRDSYIVKDGLISIRRSYRKKELQAALPDGWNVKRKFPFRLLAIYQLQNG